ncbi:hypothetical protein GZ77_03980 [Endozoicomonas montiporae]|uniref:DUF2158 domain-containing protein n=2 Tax=Endozoicomonas montiporae TaxID=1027273 RepID=A0A081NBA2_9GAMM|nr:DUF2158 domain-containing protein [Endozoicomonas montiporae]AMO56004.1 hypothetical protein EZMO1_1861 [Endozoicomonas montiporae CL-33]KEQ15725.1 hypothetical protein GZ77_03980 [Endozoicomonas montiporae]
MMPFTHGDVVQLKSGGPLMTVTGIVGVDQHLADLKAIGFSDGDVSVEYFDNNKLERATFRSTSLEKYEE